MKYTKSHEWIVLENGIATVGITRYGSGEIGTPVFVELPKVGTRLASGEEAAVVESTKAAADLHSPVSGEVVEINLDLVKNPGLLAEDPESSGWLFKIALEDLENPGEFLTGEEYTALLRS